MRILNDQGYGSVVVDAVAPFLEAAKDVLPLFEEPSVVVGADAIIASLHLHSRRADLPGDAIERILATARKADLSARISAEYRDGAQGVRLEISVFGFLVF